MSIISIIVPVYNTEKYLARCIDSILSQTHKNIELILVNDGSSDSSGEICDRFSSDDSRIKVIHKENGGVSSARNVGLKAATGTYIMFCDSDDKLPETAVEDLLKAVAATDSDLILGGFQSETIGSNTLTVEYQLSRHNLTLKKEEYSHGFTSIWEENNMLSACGKLFKKSIIDRYSLSFDITKVVLEDGSFVVDYLNVINSISSTDSTVYCVCSTVNRQSWLTRSKKDYVDDVLDYSRKIKDFFIDNSIGKNERCWKGIYSCFEQALWSLWSVQCPTFSEKMKKYKRLHSVLKKPEYKAYIKSRKDHYSASEYFCLRNGWVLTLSVLYRIHRII